jgi:hypothetical protein
MNSSFLQVSWSYYGFHLGQYNGRALPGLGLHRLGKAEIRRIPLITRFPLMFFFRDAPFNPRD